MGDFVCGDCGSPCPSAKGCPKCWGPVFDRATEAGRAAAQDYVDLQGESAHRGTREANYIPILLIALALLPLYRYGNGWLAGGAQLALGLVAAASWALPDWNGQRARQKASARVAAPTSSRSP